MEESIEIPLEKPIIYPKGFEAQWLNLDDYRELYAIIYGDYPLKDIQYMGQKITVIFLSPVDSKLHPNYIRILSVDAYFYENTMFLENLRYYGEYMWDELKTANDVDDALQDIDSYVDKIYSLANIYYLDEIIFSFDGLLNELAFQFDSIKSHKGGMTTYDF